MDWFLINLIDGLVTGLLLFLLSSGLTLIFSMLGVLNFAHASFYMLGAYFGYQISGALGFWLALLVAPLVVGGLGALVERHGLRRVHAHGHIPELIFTFGLALLIEELVQFVWGRAHVPYEAPAALAHPAFSIAGNAVEAYKIFMILLALGIFAGLLWLVTRTRTGLIIQAALTNPQMVQSIGHDVPRLFMLVFGAGTALAAVAGVIAGPVLGTFPGMGVVLGSIVFVTIVIGGLGSITGALIASLGLGWLTTFAKASSFSGADILAAIGQEGVADTATGALADLTTVTLPQIGDVLPYLVMVLVLVLRPSGLMGRRET
ncbi:MAG: branched-chain amino acid ABC transporter permease [Pseudomonadota bacterium]